MTRLAPSADGGGLPDRVARLERQMRALETAPGFAAGRAKGGTTYWADVSGVDQIRIGLQADGTYAIQIGSSLIVHTATGPKAGGVVQANGGVNTGDRNFKFTKTTANRLDITTS